MFKKNLIHGLIASFGWIAFLTIAATIRYGVSWWSDPENGVLTFFPIWALITVYVGYGASKYYYSQKQIYLDSSDENAPLKWQNHKRWMYAKLLMIFAKMFAIAIPFYILAYFDKSMYISSSIGLIIIFVLICIISYFCSKWLFAKYKQNAEALE